MEKSGGSGFNNVQEPNVPACTGDVPRLVSQQPSFNCAIRKRMISDFPDGPNQYIDEPGFPGVCRGTRLAATGRKHDDPPGRAAPRRVISLGNMGLGRVELPTKLPHRGRRVPELDQPHEIVQLR